jgi:hypothetical protein
MGEGEVPAFCSKRGHRATIQPTGEGASNKRTNRPPSDRPARIGMEEAVFSFLLVLSRSLTTFFLLGYALLFCFLSLCMASQCVCVSVWCICFFGKQIIRLQPSVYGLGLSLFLVESTRTRPATARATRCHDHSPVRLVRRCWVLSRFDVSLLLSISMSLLLKETYCGSDQRPRSIAVRLTGTQNNQQLAGPPVRLRRQGPNRERGISSETKRQLLLLLWGQQEPSTKTHRQNKQLASPQYSRVILCLFLLLGGRQRSPKTQQLPPKKRIRKTLGEA